MINIKITRSISKVRHGESFFVSFIFTDFAFVDTLRALKVLVTFSVGKKSFINMWGI